MNQIKTVFIEELKDSIKSKRVIFTLIITILLMLIFYEFEWLLKGIYVFFSVNKDVPFLISITYYLLFITTPFFAVMLGHDIISSEIETNTVRAVISKIRRSSFIIGKFLALFTILFFVAFLLISFTAFRSFALTSVLDVMHPLIILLYLVLYIAACTAIVTFFSSISTKGSTSLLLLTVFFLAMQYFNSDKTGFMTLFRYINNIISMENVFGAVVAFAIYCLLFLAISLITFRGRDL